MAAACSRWSGRVALVTGASSGIGAAISHELVMLGMKVVGCARSIDRIEETSSKLPKTEGTGSLHGIKCDLSKPDEITAMFAEIKEKYGGVDVCVNNAGLAHPSTLLEGKTEDFRNMLDVNVLALCICTREAIKSMRDRNIDDGHVIHINSTTGHRVLQFSNHMYAATKHAVTALTEGLRQELRDIKSHIRITAVSPAVVHTEFRVRMFPDDPDAGKVYHTVPCLKAKDVADAVLYALQAPPHVQVHEVIMRHVDAEN